MQLILYKAGFSMHFFIFPALLLFRSPNAVMIDTVSCLSASEWSLRRNKSVIGSCGSPDHPAEMMTVQHHIGSDRLQKAASGTTDQDRLHIFTAQNGAEPVSA
jgi:hypothetical protein